MKKKPLGAQLLQARKERGWSLAEVARRAGCLTAEALRQIELGIIHDPGVRKISKLTGVLGVSMVDLLDDEDTDLPRETARCEARLFVA